MDNGVTVGAAGIGLIALNKDLQVEPLATQRIRDQRIIDADLFERVYATRPILRLSLGRAGFKNIPVTVVAKFRFIKDGSEIGNYLFPEEFSEELIFYPPLLPRLFTPRSRVGNWEIQAGIAVVRTSDLGFLEQNELAEYLESLPYEQVASLQWEVAHPERLFVTGEIYSHRRRGGEDRDRAVDASSV